MARGLFLGSLTSYHIGTMSHSTVATERVELTEALSEERVSDLVTKLRDLPDGAAFQESVEQDMWESLGGTMSEDEIAYEKLPQESRSIIGFVEDDTLPWWLEEFDWTVDYLGETIELSEEGLANFEDADPSRAWLRRPTLADDGVTSVLDAFSAVEELLTEQLDIEASNGGYSFPDSVFAIEDGRIETTDEFGDWYSVLLQYFPPTEPLLTVLFLANSRIPTNIAHEVFPDKILSLLDSYGFTDGDSVENKTYRYQLNTLVKFSGVCFDRRVALERNTGPLGPMEYLLYEQWGNDVGSDSTIRKWINRAATDEPQQVDAAKLAQFAEFGLTSPIILHGNKPGFITVGFYADNSGYYNSDSGRLASVQEILHPNSDNA